MKNVVSMHGELGKRGASHPDRVAMKDERSTLTFAELDARANQVARALRDAGYEPGDMLAVLLSNRLEWGEIQYGCFRAGVVPAGINFRFAPAQAAAAIESIDADGFLFESRYADAVAEIREEVSVPDDRFLELGSEPASPSYEAFRNGHSDARPPFQGASVDDPAVVWFTSGTTGQPKPMVWTQRSLINHAYVYGYALGLNDGESAFLLMPFFHANSQLYFMGALYVGTDVYVHRATEFDPAETLELMEAEGSTFTSMVPTHYNQMLYDVDVDEYDLSSLRVVLSSSAPLSEGLKRELIEVLDCDVAEGYGASETGIPIMLRPEDPDEKIGSIGTPMAGCDAAVRDPETLEVVETGEVGEIFMQVPFGMEGYYEMPEKTDEVVVEIDGRTWRTAGDMGRMDEDGYISVESRKDDMIITGGENVYPSSIEEVLYEHEAIKDVTVIGVPDEKWGERLHVVAIPSGEARPSLEEIREFCRGTVADYEIPKGVDYVTELPRNSTGKIRRREVQARFENESSDAAAGADR